MTAKNTPVSRKRTPAAPSDLRALAIRRVLWIIGLLAWAGITASLLSFNTMDPPGHGVAPLHAPGGQLNWMGPTGAFIAYHTVSMIGSGVWIIVLCAGAYLALVAFRGTVTHVLVRAIGVIMVGLTFSGFHALLMPNLSSFPEGGGGLVAIAGVHELATRFGFLGAALWLTLMGIVGLTVAFDDWFAAVAAIVSKPINAMTRLAPALAGMGGMLGRMVPARSAPVPVTSRTPAPKSRNAAVIELEEETETPEVAEIVEAKPVKSRRAKAEAEETEALQVTATPPTAIDPIDHSAEVSEVEDDEAEVEVEAAVDEADDDEPTEFDPDDLREKIAKLPLRFAGAERRAATQEDMDLLRSQNVNNEELDKQYIFPSLDLLIDPEAGYEEELESYIREQATALESALHTYNIKGEIAGIESGPVITLYQVRLAPGTKVSTITAVSSDIARALKAVNIRIVPNTEGLDTVGIEVPNRKKEKVRLKELMTRTETTGKMKLPLFLGKDASGRPLIIDLAALPHMLIAGTTGSGKSVCMNAIIMGFLYTQKPSDLKLILVDPKVVELSQFKAIPHLMCPVVTDMSKAAAILEWAVGKMDERYELLAEAGCRDIAAYNGLGWDELRERFNPQSEAEEAGIPRKLPYMVFIIDELADLMMTNKEVESSIVRIAQKARAVGIHLILATQRPQANVVTGLIKSNMPGRLSFKVASGMDSRIVLDQKGGELLLGQGDMLFITPRNASPMRAQGTLVDDSEIRNVVRFVREVSSPSFEHQLVQLRGGGTPEPGSVEHEQRMLENAQEDPLFDRAVEIVLETKRGSVSLLQRRLAIGYTRASRLIELMGMAGIIGDHKGSVAREVTMTLDEWQAIKKQAEMDAQESKAASTKPTANSTQPKLFPEPVTAKEIIESKRLAEPVSVVDEVEVEEAPFDVAPVRAEPARVVAPAVKLEPVAPAAVAEEIEEEEEEEEEVVDEVEESDEVIEAEDAAEIEEEEEESEDIEDALEEAELEDAAEEGEEEDTELEDSVELEEEEAAADLADEAEAETEDDEFEYEYEYVEVAEGEELSDEYEVVEEESTEKPAAAPPLQGEIVVKPQAKSESATPES